MSRAGVVFDDFQEMKRVALIICLFEHLAHSAFTEIFLAFAVAAWRDPHAGSAQSRLVVSVLKKHRAGFIHQENSGYSRFLIVACLSQIMVFRYLLGF